MASPRPPSSGQDARLRELRATHPHVETLALADGALAATARSLDGELQAAEVLARDGRPVSADEAAAAIAAARLRAVTAAEAATDALIAHLALRAAAGDTVNLSAIARDAGLARQTLYNRLEDLQPRPRP